jgi:hypothetical protein
VAVLSTAAADLDQLTDPPADNLRILIRDVLAKAARFDTILSLQRDEESEPEVVRIDEAPDVVIELIPPDRQESLPPEMASEAP